MHSLDRVNRAWDRQRQYNIGPGVIGACPRFDDDQNPDGWHSDDTTATDRKRMPIS